MIFRQLVFIYIRARQEQAELHHAKAAESRVVQFSVFLPRAMEPITGIYKKTCPQIMIVIRPGPCAGCCHACALRAAAATATWHAHVRRYIVQLATGPMKLSLRLGNLQQIVRRARLVSEEDAPQDPPEVSPSRAARAR